MRLYRFCLLSISDLDGSKAVDWAPLNNQGERKKQAMRMEISPGVSKDCREPTEAIIQVVASKLWETFGVTWGTKLGTETLVFGKPWSRVGLTHANWGMTYLSFKKIKKGGISNL